MPVSCSTVVCTLGLVSGVVTSRATDALNSSTVRVGSLLSRHHIQRLKHEMPIQRIAQPSKY